MRKVNKLSLAVVRLYFIVKHTRTRCVLKAVYKAVYEGLVTGGKTKRIKVHQEHPYESTGVFTLACKEWLVWEGGTRRAAHQIHIQADATLGEARIAALCLSETEPVETIINNASGFTY